MLFRSPVPSAPDACLSFLIVFPEVNRCRAADASTKLPMPGAAESQLVCKRVVQFGRRNSPKGECGLPLQNRGGVNRWPRLSARTAVSESPCAFRAELGSSPFSQPVMDCRLPSSCPTSIVPRNRWSSVVSAVRGARPSPVHFESKLTIRHRLLAKD